MNKTQNFVEDAAVSYPVRPVPSLHDATSGRLDAECIAAFFSLSSVELAQILEVPPFILQQPDAPELQPGLLGLERIAAALLFMAGNEENGRLWLSLPEIQISNQTPLALIKQGRGQVVAEILEDMTWGQPS